MLTLSQLKASVDILDEDNDLTQTDHDHDNDETDQVQSSHRSENYRGEEDDQVIASSEDEGQQAAFEVRQLGIDILHFFLPHKHSWHWRWCHDSSILLALRCLLVPIYRNEQPRHSYFTHEQKDDQAWSIVIADRNQGKVDSWQDDFHHSQVHV